MTIFSDGIVKGDIVYDESVFTKLANFVQNIARVFGYNKEFENGRQVYNFMKSYNKSAKKGKVSDRAVKFAEDTKDLPKSKDVKGKKKVVAASRGKLIDDINDLQQGAITKDDFQKPETFNKVFESVQSGGAVNNYIRSLQMSPEKTQETIDAVTDRLINFDPAAKRKDGTVGCC